MAESKPNQRYPRLLVVSNNSFSKTSSNGRTLGNLLIDWPKDKIAQFCVSTAEPDFDICNNYFMITDRSMVHSFIRLIKGTRCDINVCKGTEGNTVIGGKKVFKTPWKALARHIIWSGRRWNSKEFRNWVDGFDPEVILVMNSDATFILDIATDISKKRRIPLVMYNTEGFYFFSRLYSRRSMLFNNSLLKLYQHLYKKHFRNTMNQVSLSIYCNSLLKDDYERVFGGNSAVIYTGSKLVFNNSNLHTECPTFTYLGNLGFDRPSALIEIADVLQSINPHYELYVYGRVPSLAVEKRFAACKGLVYKGMVTYEEVIRAMYRSTVLFHAEGQSELYKEVLRYGFSTKIADSIASGRPFLMYSSPDIAGARYIIETGAAWFAQSRDDLKNAIIEILTDSKSRDKVLSVARITAEKNHRIERNRELFVKAIKGVLETSR